MAICGIYKITNDVNGHAYIGQAVDVFVRWRQHFNEAYNPESNAYDGYFYRAVRKYGVENFSMKVLEVCKPEELNDREIFYIKKFDTYRNNVRWFLLELLWERIQFARREEKSRETSESIYS